MLLTVATLYRSYAYPAQQHTASSELAKTHPRTLTPTWHTPTHLLKGDTTFGLMEQIVTDNRHTAHHYALIHTRVCTHTPPRTHTHTRMHTHTSLKVT